MENFLLVDGYNVIFAWDNLNKLSKQSIDAARMKLQDTLSNYQGFRKEHVIVVFDGYKVKGNPGEVHHYHNIDVVFTKEAETADQYIEKVTGSYVRQGSVRVVTSDRLEQIIILGEGATRVSAREFQKEIREMKHHIRKNYTEVNQIRRNSLLDHLSPEQSALLEQLRLKETE